MPGLSRRSRYTANTWPGFVDALASLLMVVVFLVLVFALAQILLGETLRGRESALKKLGGEVSQLSDLLALERKSNQALRANVNDLSTELQSTLSERDTLKTATTKAQEKIAALSGDVASLSALKKDLESKIAQMASKLDETKGSLLREQDISNSARAKVALLNQQMAALRDQLAQISAALDASEKRAKAQNVQIVALGKRLNSALASKVQELSRYRSEFFGRLRQVLGNQAGIRIVGDRFVFQSEVLFASGEADIGPNGQAQLDKLATTLRELAQKIPKGIDWVLRVDGHTDKVPIHNNKFASNWELSSARAISVVKYLISKGIPPSRLVAAGFGQYQPIDNRDDEIAYRRNRRIELKLTQR
ncbi:peptidoglycan -binding protein [Varunaivibrio sulfuroxidans]|uniref:Chemotaxis protein MotB n=1 Tax=Varunaivibrio sulfuroxidans TaxID=1773489 RepID=A0A4R3JB55_9PROT|nr:peptidoglycan -binding protein [Varunaivibrio sulfuroxidans]TCS63128.1 chemotaxis protein MotB [Varunaivibrio sulfuroxidans]WES31802.1 peptidoglycan -binding protein [Varunaivibrio sulfuroxidans]